jgi:hypothetical protein
MPHPFPLSLVSAISKAAQKAIGCAASQRPIADVHFLQKLEI